jgi:DNA-binding NarL/FixJ family response regulator
LDSIDKLKKQGLSESEIARGMGMTTTQLRAQKTIAINQQKLERIHQVQKLQDKGLSNVAIGKQLGINESTVRSLSTAGQKDKTNVLHTTADMLKDQVNEQGYIDVGKGVENHLGISKDKLATAVAMLQEEGYKLHYVKVSQLGTGEKTLVKVLGKPGAPYPKFDQINQPFAYSDDGGRSYFKPQPPISINSKRVDVVYGPEGGANADGVIYIRPGVKDVSIGSNNYAQVRVAVDGTHYLKGMAVYKDDLPEGVDLVFNTNKENTGNKKDAMKVLEDDPENPFGSQISRQIIEKDANGKDVVTSTMNMVNEEGKWDTWSKNLPSQMLSKQSPALAQAQLNLTYERRSKEYDSIVKMTNPTVRKKLLESFADETDSAAVHLRAAAMPGQATKVLLPLTTVKPTEIYAPSLRNGTRVALVRFPHGGTFEIPQLTVNNRNPEGRKLLGTSAKDAVGIHADVARRLSGADFDGDTVLVIPYNSGSVKSTPALEGLKDFDPIHSYKIPEDSSVPRISKDRKEHEMGNITNLIADMSIRGADTDELARAVRHSMVVIDSEKHGLDYKQSAADNAIAELKSKYQGEPAGSKNPTRAGASTLLTLATSEARVPQRKPRPAKEGGPIDPVTGKKVYKETGETYLNKKGETVPKTTKSQKLAETDDAATLSSDTPMERVYVAHSNKLKALANDARKEMVATKAIPYSSSAKATYENEVASLESKLNLALKNAPLERQAQLIANANVSQKRQANPNMAKEDVKKVQNQALAEARSRTGAGKQRIVLSQSEWDAIQAGAISNHKLEQILNNADLDTVKKLATPKSELLMTTTKTQRATQMLSSGYTQIEVADALGVSLSTLKASLSGS